MVAEQHSLELQCHFSRKGKSFLLAKLIFPVPWFHLLFVLSILYSFKSPGSVKPALPKMHLRVCIFMGSTQINLFYSV